ncbi:MAG: magnesium transporter MgtE [Phycisphaerae bacterium]|nr:Magnesium transporter MgtE [Phycisphaerales bacterium]
MTPAPRTSLCAQLLEPEVRELVREGAFSDLRRALHGVHPADVADILTELGPDDAALAFRFLTRDQAGEVFGYLSPEFQEQLITKLGEEQSVSVVENMSADDRARILDELPHEVAQRLVASLSPESRKVTQAILGYPPRSVGRLMTPDYIRVRPEWTVQHALDHIRKYGRDAETINVVYVVDDNGQLIDDLRLRQVLLSDPNQSIQSIMNHQFVTLKADDDRSEAVAAMARYDRTALPVVDSRGVLLGIVTHDDVADVAQAEATEDIQKLGGMEALEAPYIQTGHYEMFRKRGFWLSALFIGQTITILVLGSFQDQIEKAAVLSVFMPLVISCGGNSGSQAATLITRALALGEVTSKDWLKIVGREIVTALMLAGTLAAMGMVCVEVFTRLLKHPHTDFPIQLGITVAGAVFAVVIWGTVLGSLLPLLLKRMKVDPATASSPMVATLMDASGTLIYLGMAILVLSGSLL